MTGDKKCIKNSLILISVIYLLGIFMGAIDTGIVTPARTIIQNHFLVDDKTGIWIITIYTLGYASAIPVMGKLADRYGRKIIYIISIFLFGLGSLLCGLSKITGSFSMLIIARAVQAVGGGGIMPVATAEFGTSFPPEKRGMALGLVGGVYGIAHIFGSLFGSMILDIFGSLNWQYVFYINIPISILIILGGVFILPNHKETAFKKIDGPGTLVLILLVLSLLYGLKQIDFFDFKNTMTRVDTYLPLAAFVVLMPVFILVEKRAEDPIIHLQYFTSRSILITLVVAFISGFVMMGIIFIPQFCENALKIDRGSGGYFTVVLGLLSGVSAMLSGRLIDKIGAKRVLILGFSITIIGALFLVFVATVMSSLLTVIPSLMLLGFGLGFTMGAPLNYMMLENIDSRESNSGLATLSLLRSVGTSIAPAILVGFLAYAGSCVQANLMETIPGEIIVYDLPYVEEITKKFKKLKSDSYLSEKLKNIDFPDLSVVETIQLDFSDADSIEIPNEVIERLNSADVTTISTATLEMSEAIICQMVPGIAENIQKGLSAGMAGIPEVIAYLDTSLSDMQAEYDELKQNADGMQSVLEAQATLQSLVEIESNMENIVSRMAELESLTSQMQALSNAIPAAYEAAKENYLGQLEGLSDEIEGAFQKTLNQGYRAIYITVGIAALISIAFLLLYRRGTPREQNARDNNAGWMI